MKKPVLNIDELTYESDGPDAPGQTAQVANLLGAKKLGYNVSVCPPGKSVCPFHNHRINEEMFFVLEGSGTLRFGVNQFPIRKGDFIACPPGGREFAHQMINTGTTNLVYIALSTKVPEEICEYPDSDKVGVFVGDYGKMELRQLFRASTNLPYWDGETNSILKA